MKKETHKPSFKLSTSRFDTGEYALLYGQQQRGLWRMVVRETYPDEIWYSVAGSTYNTRAELLADLPRVAAGHNSDWAEPEKLMTPPMFSCFARMFDAAEFRSKYGGWLFDAADRVFWFDMSHTPTAIMKHSALVGVSGKLL